MIGTSKVNVEFIKIISGIHSQKSLNHIYWAWPNVLIPLSLQDLRPVDSLYIKTNNMKTKQKFSLFICCFLYSIFGLDAVSLSDSTHTSINDNPKQCVCQINFSPNSDCHGAASDTEEELRIENTRMNETIWLLQEEVRRLKSVQGRICFQNPR